MTNPTMKGRLNPLFNGVEVNGVEVNGVVMVLCTTLQVGKSSLGANSSNREDETGEDGFCLLA